MPRKMLYSNEMNSIIEKHLTGNTEWEKKEASVHISFMKMNVTYFYNKNKNFVVIPSPLAVKKGSGDAEEPSYQSAVAAITNQIGNGKFGIGCSLLGKGTGERHYAALFKEKGDEGKVTVFDSKISSPNQFFNSSESPDFFEKIGGFIQAPFKAFGLWAFEIGKEIKSSFLGKDVTVHRLASQPFFDGVSCGFHSSGAVLNMIDLIGKKEVTTEEIILSITTHKDLDSKAEHILNGKKDEAIPGMNPILSSLVSKERDESGALGFYEHDNNETITKEVVVSSPVKNDDLDTGSSHQSQP
ncbi:MAG: hypothetical protein P4L79_17590 [Legionella sp.]|uniref:hypothetical protein n=1 Tax=Legionella sp. TaxID=459 RepID=UPI00284902EE|nr:hypothetical protein [Legionella sp.]